MFDSDFCAQGCHVDAGVFENTEVHATAGPNNNTLECWKCHSSPEARQQGRKQVHGIRYVEQDGTYSGPADESNAADCQTCHQDRVIDTVWNTSIPEIPEELFHSFRREGVKTDEPMGSRWNTTQNGHLGPWGPRVNNVNGCNYCHGDVETALHNDTALGRVNAAYDGGPVNTDIKTGKATFWCGSCHYPPSADYDAMMQGFDQAGLERPPKNTGPGVPFDHSAFLGANAADSTCASNFCHGRRLSRPAMTSEFVHDVWYPPWGPSGTGGG